MLRVFSCGRPPCQEQGCVPFGQALALPIHVPGEGLPLCLSVCIYETGMLAPTSPAHVRLQRGPSVGRCPCSARPPLRRAGLGQALLRPTSAGGTAGHILTPPYILHPVFLTLLSSAPSRLLPSRRGQASWGRVALTTHSQRPALYIHQASVSLSAAVPNQRVLQTPPRASAGGR